ncbi:MAG: zinc transporter ZntB [Caulobacterales bacterium]|uniref:zinc transporter ZntB n=1 Tax=Glycocaulis sp. TaxID=1969725 RepID=UPI003F9FDCC2
MVPTDTERAPALLPPVLCFAMDGRGAAEPADLAAAADGAGEEAKPESRGKARPPFVWVHLQRGDPRTATWLEEASGLDPVLIAALLAEDTRPRCTVHADGAIIILRGVNLMEGAEPEDMVSVRLWVERSRVIGVWVRPLRAVGDLVGAIERGLAPSSPGELVAKLVQRLADRMEPSVAELHEEIDTFEDALLDGEEMERGALADLRRRAIRLRRHIGPQRDALTTLGIEDLSWLNEKDRTRIREAADKTTRILEELEVVRERASVVQDQIAEARAEKMNRYTLLLSVVAAIFLPLGLLTGLLGINVGGIPGEGNPWAFAIVSGVLVVIAGIQVALFRLMRLF